MKIMKGHEGFLEFFLHDLHALHGENSLAQTTRNDLRSY